MKSAPFDIYLSSGTQLVRSACRDCTCGCGVLIHVQDGRVVKIEGDPDHPLSRGFMCCKGLSHVQLMYHPERLKYPLKRIGERGSGKWQRVTWDEALNEIATRLLEIKNRYGPESIVAGALPPKPTLCYLALLKALNSPMRFTPIVHYCAYPNIMADITTFGYKLTVGELATHDLSKSRCIMLWGCNPAATLPPRARHIMDAKARGAKLIVVDPVFIPLASKADLWMQVRPATDAALAMGMINVMINEKLYDFDFVEKHCEGFEDLKERVKDFIPAMVSAITWVPEDTIVKAARMYAKSKPAILFPYLGVSMQPNAVQSIRAITSMIALTGNVDIEGANMFPIYPNITTFFDMLEFYRLEGDGDDRQFGAKEFPLLAGSKSLFGAIHPPTLIKAMLSGEPNSVKAMFTSSNLLGGLEDAKLVAQALGKLDLLVVFDLFMSTTAEFADFVLPGTTYVESDGLYDLYNNFVTARQKAVEPFYECRDENEVIFDLAKKMNIKLPYPVSTYKELLDWRVKGLGMSFEEFKKKGYAIQPQVERKYEKGLLRPDGKPGFNTPSGKIEFYSHLLEAHGYDPLPHYKEPHQSPLSLQLSAEYPFVLISGSRHLAMYNSQAPNVPWLRELLPYANIAINPVAAKKYNIEEGDDVWIETPRHKARVKRRALLTEGIDPRVVCVEGLWWNPEEKDPEKRRWEANINAIMSLEGPYDPIIGSTLIRGGLCRISRMER